MYVLPSIAENVFVPNAGHGCDYYLHYHDIDREGTNRVDEAGGPIRGDDVRLLEDALRTVVVRHHRNNHNNNRTAPAAPMPRISITSSTEDGFRAARGADLHRYETALDANGRYLYFPWKAPTWEHPVSLRNLVKQWDSIEAVWRHMEATAAAAAPEEVIGSGPPYYDRVAMLRSDVVYVTPIDVWERSGGTAAAVDDDDGDDNTLLRIPDWANYPVNDRMVIGPYEAVEVWATRRFELIEGHVRDYPLRGTDGPGWGMHSERFLGHTLLPVALAAGQPAAVNTTARRGGGGNAATNAPEPDPDLVGDHSDHDHRYALDPDPSVCFLRARADGSVWTRDCAQSPVFGGCALGSAVAGLVLGYHPAGSVRCERERWTETGFGSLRCDWRRRSGGGNNNDGGEPR